MTVPMTDDELALFRQFIGTTTGIELDASKRYLLEARLEALLNSSDSKSYHELFRRAKSAHDRSLEQAIVDAVSTHETSFFRDSKCFDLIRDKLVPDITSRRADKSIGIWSAACSTGQEAYSVAMSLHECLAPGRPPPRVFGSDVSESSVATARRGEYSSMEVNRGLDTRRINQHLVRTGERYRIRDELRALCTFEVDNLLSPHTRGPFDIILCRNVLIYFSPSRQTEVVALLLKRLAPHGAIIVGSTESLLGHSDRLVRHEHLSAAYYTLRP